MLSALRHMTPCKKIYDTLYKLPTNCGQGDIALGFPAADFPNTRTYRVAYSGKPQEAQAICNDIALRFDIYKNVFDLSLLDPSTAADEVNAHKGAKPILLADVQDNPGGGAPSMIMLMIAKTFGSLVPSMGWGSCKGSV